MNTPNDLVSITEAAKLLPGSRPGRAMNRHVLRRWVRAGRIPSYRLGSRYFVSRAEVVALVQPHNPLRLKPPPIRTTRQETAGYRRAIDSLRAAGIRC